jgi:hypothetical protein
MAEAEQNARRTICHYRRVSDALGASAPVLLTIRKPSRFLTGRARDALCPRSSTCPPPRPSSRRSETGWLSDQSPLVPHPFFCVLRCAIIRAKRFIRRTPSIKLREGSRFRNLKTKLRMRLSTKSRSYLFTPARRLGHCLHRAWQMSARRLFFGFRNSNDPYDETDSPERD